MSGIGPSQLRTARKGRWIRWAQRLYHLPDWRVFLTTAQRVGGPKEPRVLNELREVEVARICGSVSPEEKLYREQVPPEALDNGYWSVNTGEKLTWRQSKDDGKGSRKSNVQSSHEPRSSSLLNQLELKDIKSWSTDRLLRKVAS